MPVSEIRTTAVPVATVSAPAPFNEATARETVQERLTGLMDNLPEALRRNDAPVILSALADTMDATVGQPPAAAMRALRVSRDPDSSVSDLVNLFTQDPGLAQGLLRYANSSYYTGLGNCSSLGIAVQRIGSAGVENVLLTSTLRGVLCRPGGHYDAMVEQVWSHMVRCGPLARDIAPAFGVDPERVFSLGLLHDAGKLILFEQVSAYRRSQQRAIEIPNRLLFWALKRMHEPVGGLAAVRWGLPEEAARAIAHHHREPAPACNDPLSEVIFLAEKLDLAGLLGVPADLEAIWAAGSLSGDFDAVKAMLQEPDQKAA